MSTTGENIAIEGIKNETREAVTKSEGRRAAHPKAHGCVRAQFIVDPSGLPPDARVGVFKQNRTFDAWIRFSSANTTPQNDSVADVRGMAIKLVGVEGTKLLESEKEERTQDFILISHEVFFARNAQEFGIIMSLAKGKPEFESLKNQFLPQLGILKAMQESEIQNPLRGKYWSTVPSRLGPRSVKYHAVAISEVPLPSDTTSPNFMREAMKAHLQDKEARFEFSVQFHKDEATTPIEDPTVPWSTDFVRVATIVIPPQDFTSPAQMEFCENLSFTPWHSLPEHEPLGAINGARKPVYDTGSGERHRLRNVERKEPAEAGD
jgi:hypothetical protein